MLRNVLSKFVGDANQRELKKLEPIVEEINSLEPKLESLSDKELRLKTREFKERLQAGDSLDDLMVEAFAVVREAAKRTVYMRHFDVQLMGGIVLHQGKVAEMKTGEGKTLVATLPLYLNALEGKGVHLVTVNDYLARRDTQWMGPVYYFLGLSVGLLQQGGKAFLYDPSYEKGDYRHLRPVERREAYLADITYGTNSEFGFDYLRDNMATDLSQCVQRGLHYAIVDEADYILIDEARTPLIISGPSAEPLDEYRRFAQIAKKLQPGIDYEVDLKDRVVTLTERGLARVEQELGLINIYDEQNYKYVHFMEQALKAEALYERDRDYIRQGQNIILIDEFTGRLMPDRRLSDGLHQAIEAKEGVRIKPRTMTYATITIQNYFRMYEKLAGMTGTAATAAEELYQIYGLDVVVIPTNKPMIRIDYPDVVYRTEEAKWKAIVREIEECHRAGRPVLVGTTSVEKSEKLSRRLKKKGIPHQVLNAKNHAKEAAIIARAGEPGAVTVATKMAGRGVDIKLGGELSQEVTKRAQDVLRKRGINPFKASEAQMASAIAEVFPDYALRREKVLKLGGLHIIGTERHEARRIDDQLRGRAGRQGDPGSSRFYLSLEDDLMRRFGGPGLANLMQRLGVEDDVPIEHGLVSKAIENAQSRIEGYNFDIRKHLLEYDDVLNTQRQLIYDQRRKILAKEDLTSDLWEMVQEEIEDRASQADSLWELLDYLDRIIPLSFPPPDSPFRYPFPFDNLTCLPPFSISFLAERLEGQEPKALGPYLMELNREALEGYKQHLLDKAIEERLEWIAARYKEDLADYSLRLEELIDDFLAAYGGLAEEPWRNLLRGLQRAFPLTLNVKPSDLQGLGAEEVKERLMAALEESYHQRACKILITSIEGHTPAALGLADVKPQDLPRQDIEELFERARDAAQNGGRLEEIERRARKGGYDNLVQLLLELNELTLLDLDLLGRILRRALTKAYDGWAARQLDEIEASIRSSLRELRSSSAKIVPMLLEVYYTKRTFFDKHHKRWVFPTPRFPLAFLAAASIEGEDSEQLHNDILGHLRALLEAREDLWGEEALRTMGQWKLGELASELLDGFAGFLSMEMVKGRERIGDLDEDMRESACRYLWIQRLTQLTLEELDPKLREGIIEYLDRRMLEDMERKVSELDNETRAEAERYLRASGHFDDERKKEALFRRRIDELGEEIREELARYWGHRLLEEIGKKPIAELDEATKQFILSCLRGRGHFVDEEKLRRFLTHQGLSDLGEETRRAVIKYLNRERLERLKGKKIGNLPLDIRRDVMNYLKEKGCFTDEAKKRKFARLRIRELEGDLYLGLVQRLGRQQLEGVERIADLPGELRDGLWRHLQGRGLLTDEEKAASFPEMQPSDLGQEVLEEVQHRLLKELEAELERRQIGELEEALEESVIDYLKELDYFVDEAKVRSFRQRPLADLEASMLHGLESHLGHRLLAEIGERKFLNLDRDLRESVLRYFDEKGLFKGKAERQRFIQRQSLSDLRAEVYEGLARHLGRRVLAKVKGLRFAQLPDEVRETVWSYLRENGYFIDEELVALVRESKLVALEPEVRESILTHLAQEIQEELSEQRVADMKDYIRSGLRRYLEEIGYFVDEDKARRIEQTRVAELDGEIKEEAIRYLGQRLLRGFNERRIAEIEGELKECIWRYLDENGCFLDKAKKEQYAQQRLSDLDSALYASLSERLAIKLEEELKGQKVADLDEDSRQAIRAYLLSETDHFVNAAEMEECERQCLMDLEEEDQQAVALSLGRRRLEEMGSKRLADLEEEAQEEVKRYLRERGLIFDEEKWQRFQQQRLRDLDDEIYAGLINHLKAKRAKALKGHRISDLKGELGKRIQDYLRQESSHRGEEFEEQKLSDLEPELREGLLRHLGRQKLKGNEGKRIVDLDEEFRQALRCYFGRRAMHEVQKQVMLGVIDRLWVEYLTDIEDLRQGIGLEAFGQRDPLVEYKRKAYEMFQDLLTDIRRSIVGGIFRASPPLLTPHS